MSETGMDDDLIGRDAELDRVRSALEADRAIVVTGEPGIGKTALIRAAAAADGRPFHEGGGFATLDWMPYLALTRATRRDLAGDADWAASAVERVVGPDILFIDDLQWADAATVAVLERLVGRMTLVVAARVDDDEAQAKLERLTAVGAERLDVAPLAPEAAAALARRVRPGLSAARADRIAERTGGNPLLIEQLAASGENDSLRRAVAARLRDLSGEDRATLALIVLADRPLDAAAVGAAGERLVERGFVARSKAGIAVRHALLAEAVLADLDEPTRCAAHARLATLVDDPGERARHLAAAGDRVGAHDAAMAAVATATTAGERAAHLGLAASTADGASADRLRIDAAAALRVAGDLDGAVALLDAVGAADPEMGARAEAIRARVCWSAGDPEGMRAAVTRGLDRVGGHGSPAEAMLRAEAVVVTALVDGRFEEGLRDAESAIELARTAGADVSRPLLLRATLLAGLGLDGWDGALEAVIAATRATGDAETELSAANNLIAGHEMHGEPRVGRSLALDMTERARVLRLAGWERQFEAMLTNLDLHSGDLSAAVVRAETLLEEPLDPLAAQQVGLACACALVDLGRLEEADAILSRLLTEAPDDAVGRCGVLHIAAEQALWGGRPTDALRRVEEYRAYGAEDHPTSHLMDVTAGWAALDARDPIPARIAVGDGEGMLLGAQLEREGIEALDTTADAATAERFDAAAAAYGGFHRRGELRSRWAAAECRRRDGQAEPARTALEALEVEADAQGFAPLAGRIRRSLRLLGVRRAAASSASAAVSHGPRLTQREREIAQLVAAGLSNVEIARRLGVGRPTVARLLSSTMDKLGVDSRTQVAARIDGI